MSKIGRGSESFVKLCTNCNHNELSYTHREKLDQSRISHSKVHLSECKQCREEGKEEKKICKEFKEKKPSWLNKIFKK